LKILCSVLITISLFLGTGFGQEVSKLAGVRKIYIDELGREEGSDLVPLLAKITPNRTAVR